jgi:hypothetical protein
MATEITPTPNKIFVEETDVKSAISEATMQRIGGSINYIIDRVYDKQNFTWNNFYRVTDISSGLNGYRYFYKATDIQRYILTNHIAGSSGTTAINFEVYDETNTLLGDLFSVPPSIDSAAGDRAVIGRDEQNSTDIEAGANKVVGTLNYTSLDAGWSIVPKITNAQVRGRNLNFELVLQEQ